MEYDAENVLGENSCLIKKFPDEISGQTSINGVKKAYTRTTSMLIFGIILVVMVIFSVTYSGEVFATKVASLNIAEATVNGQYEGASAAQTIASLSENFEEASGQSTFHAPQISDGGSIGPMDVVYGVYPDIGAVVVNDALAINVGATTCNSRNGTTLTKSCSISSCSASSCTNTCNNIVPFTRGVPYTFTPTMGCYAKLQTYSGAYLNFTLSDGK